MLTGFTKTHNIPDEFEYYFQQHCLPVPGFFTKLLKYGNAPHEFILLIFVEPSSNQIIHDDARRVYLRIGDSTKELDHYGIENLERDKGQRYFEDIEIPEASLDDIDHTILADYKARMSVSDKTDEEVLKARGLMKNGHITNAAIPKLIPAITQTIRAQLREFQLLGDDGQFKIIPEYPEFAWFEGVINAITHRDYGFRGDHIRIKMFNNRLEIFSPGKLPNIVTLKNMKETRFSRNPNI